MRPPEAKRDQHESTFTAILRKIGEALPLALATAFVDAQGECIDYVSALDPFDAKVSAAHGQVLMQELRACSAQLGLTEPFVLTMWAEARELWVRRITDDYMLVAVLTPGADAHLVGLMLAQAGREFRVEIGASPCSWEPGGRGIEVDVRAAVGWSYAPAAFTEHGVVVPISDVLGRWTEPDGNVRDAFVCFRVRADSGQELTLVHLANGTGWQRRH